MGATIHHDPTADGRSPMLRQVPLCNGAQEGFECKHYWRQVVRKDVLNPDALRKGETFRYCKLAMQAPDHNMAMFLEGDREMAVECTEYRKDRSRPFNPKADDYDPLTPEEIKAMAEGRAVPRFTPRKWWQVWRKNPQVQVVYLTPEEIAAEQEKTLGLQTKTEDAAGGGTLGPSVLDGGQLTDDHPAVADATPTQNSSEEKPS